MFGLEKEFGIGVLRAVAYYLAGSAVVWGTYLLYGWDYPHAPGLHHLVGLLVLVFGAVLLIRRLIEMFAHPANSRNKGALLIHTIAICLFILFFKLVILNGALKRDTGIAMDTEIFLMDEKGEGSRNRDEVPTSSVCQFGLRGEEKSDGVI